MGLGVGCMAEEGGFSWRSETSGWREDTKKGGERSCNWAAVSLSTMTMGPAQWGHSQSRFPG